jgi:hypothetical protein
MRTAMCVRVKTSRRRYHEQHSIHFRAKFAISEEKIKEYKKLIKEMSNLVEANEPETRCIVPETYRNPEAVFFHMDGICIKYRSSKDS